jgi:hypothetical protein
MKRAIFLASVCVVFACICWFAWAIQHGRRLQRGFDQVQRGDSEAEVVQRLGTPKRVERCGDFMGPLDNAESQGCAQEYLYASPFSPLLPQYYVVRFDTHGRVTSRTPYSSP